MLALRDGHYKAMVQHGDEGDVCPDLWLQATGDRPYHLLRGAGPEPALDFEEFSLPGGSCVPRGALSLPPSTPRGLPNTPTRSLAGLALSLPASTPGPQAEACVAVSAHDKERPDETLVSPAPPPELGMPRTFLSFGTPLLRGCAWLGNRKASTILEALLVLGV